MRIDDNAEALAMMNRALSSLEAKIREAYNKGYQDGVKSMVADGEPNSSEKPNNCETCKYKDHNWWSNKCDPCCRGNSNYEPKDEPQKDCKKCKNYDRCKNNKWKCCVYQPIEDETQTERSE